MHITIHDYYSRHPPDFPIRPKPLTINQYIKTEPVKLKSGYGKTFWREWWICRLGLTYRTCSTMPLTLPRLWRGPQPSPRFAGRGSGVRKWTSIPSTWFIGERVGPRCAAVGGCGGTSLDCRKNNMVKCTVIEKLEECYSLYLHNFCYSLRTEGGFNISYGLGIILPLQRASSAVNSS